MSSINNLSHNAIANMCQQNAAFQALPVLQVLKIENCVDPMDENQTSLKLTLSDGVLFDGYFFLSNRIKCSKLKHFDVIQLMNYIAHPIQCEKNGIQYQRRMYVVTRLEIFDANASCAIGEPVKFIHKDLLPKLSSGFVLELVTGVLQNTDELETYLQILAVENHARYSRLELSDGDRFNGSFVVQTQYPLLVKPFDMIKVVKVKRGRLTTDRGAEKAWRIDKYEICSASIRYKIGRPRMMHTTDDSSCMTTTLSKDANAEMVVPETQMSQTETTVIATAATTLATTSMTTASTSVSAIETLELNPTGFYAKLLGRRKNIDPKIADAEPVKHMRINEGDNELDKSFKGIHIDDQNDTDECDDTSETSGVELITKNQKSKPIVPEEVLTYVDHIMDAGNKFQDQEVVRGMALQNGWKKINEYKFRTNSNAYREDNLQADEPDHPDFKPPDASYLHKYIFPDTHGPEAVVIDILPGWQFQMTEGKLKETAFGINKLLCYGGIQGTHYGKPMFALWENLRVITRGQSLILKKYYDHAVTNTRSENRKGSVFFEVGGHEFRFKSTNIFNCHTCENKCSCYSHMNIWNGDFSAAVFGNHIKKSKKNTVTSSNK